MTLNFSTSRFSGLLRLALTVALTLSAGAAYIRWLNPGTEWILKLHEIKQAALQKTKGSPRVLVVGGSSVLFGVDAKALQRDLGVPCVNLGLTAGLGGLFMLGYAESAARPGDVVVLSIEPDLFTSRPEPIDGGRRFAMLIGKPDLANGAAFLRSHDSATERLRQLLRAGNPGLSMLVNDQSRRLLGLISFRYIDCGVDEFGFSFGKVIFPYERASSISQFDHEWKNVLFTFNEHMRRKGVKVYYSTPWLHVDPRYEETMRDQLVKSASKISSSIPLLDAPADAIQADSSLFSDTSLHLSNKGAQLRTKRLSRNLRNKLPISEVN